MEPAKNFIIFYKVKILQKLICCDKISDCVPGHGILGQEPKSNYSEDRSQPSLKFDLGGTKAMSYIKKYIYICNLFI